MADNRTIIHCNDEGGRKVALVPLGRNGLKGVAIVDQVDLDMLTELGLSLRWNRNQTIGTVFASAYDASGGNIQVARVILDCGPGQRIHYRNGDPTDLRRQNLELREGFALRRDREFITPSHKRRRRYGEPIRHRTIND